MNRPAKEIETFGKLDKIVQFLQGKNKMAVKNGSTIQLPENRTI
jgi:hypothetical protein